MDENLKKICGSKSKLEVAIRLASLPGQAVEFQLDNGLNCKFRWLNNPDLTKVRRICAKEHSMLKSKNIVAYTGVITVEVSGEEVHFIFWDFNNPSHLIENVANYSALYLGLTHEVVYDKQCCGRIAGRGSILSAVMQKNSPKLFVLVNYPEKTQVLG